jgi:hypothetical protein
MQLLNTRINDLGGRLNGINTRLDGIDTRLNRIETRLDEQAAGITRLSEESAVVGVF